jgi:hypothetical protein
VTALGGLLEVALHPRFAENGLVYMTYAKGREGQCLDNRSGAGPPEGNRAGGSSRYLCRKHMEFVRHKLWREDRLRSRRISLSHRRRAAGAGSCAERRRSRRKSIAAAR